MMIKEFTPNGEPDIERIIEYGLEKRMPYFKSYLERQIASFIARNFSEEEFLFYALEFLTDKIEELNNLKTKNKFESGITSYKHTAEGIEFKCIATYKDIANAKVIVANKFEHFKSACSPENIPSSKIPKGLCEKSFLFMNDFVSAFELENKNFRISRSDIALLYECLILINPPEISLSKDVFSSIINLEFNLEGLNRRLDSSKPRKTHKLFPLVKLICHKNSIDTKIFD